MKGTETHKSVPNIPEENRIETERKELGYGPDFPLSLMELHIIKIDCDPSKMLGIKLTKTMLITHVDENIRDKLDLGDWLFAVDGVEIKDKAHYYKIAAKICEAGIKRPVNYSIYRTIKTRTISNPGTSSLIPQAVEIQIGFSYLIGYLTMFPGSSLGVNIKSYNCKVYVASTDNGFKSLGMRTFMVGDAILAVDGKPQTTVQGASASIVQALSKRRRVSLVIERPETAAAIRQVRVALLAEKVKEKDPRMCDDVVEICNAEIERFLKNSEPRLKSIYVGQRSGITSIFKTFVRGFISVADNSSEAGIGMNPINPVLLQHVPPKPGPRSVKKSERRVSTARSATTKTAKGRQSSRNLSRASRIRSAFMFPRFN